MGCHVARTETILDAQIDEVYDFDYTLSEEGEKRWVGPGRLISRQNEETRRLPKQSVGRIAGRGTALPRSEAYDWVLNRR